MKRRKIQRVEIKIRALDEYCKKNNISPVNLTDEELEMFAGEKIPFNRQRWGMVNKDKCIICGKIDSYIDKYHENYICGEECTKEADRRYEAGEDFEVHPIVIQLAEDLMD